MIVTQAALVADHALVVNYEEAVPVDARDPDVSRLGEIEGVGLRVKPFSIGVKIIRVILECNILGWMPCQEQVRPCLRRADMRVADVVIDIAHPAVEGESRR